MKPLKLLPRPMVGHGVRELADLAMQIDDAIDLSVGQPDFFTPAHIVEAGCDAARMGYTKYSPFSGYVSLCEKLAAKLLNENRIKTDIENITVTAGGTFGVAVSIMAVISASDEVLVPDPGYTIFAQNVSLSGAVPIPYPLEEKNGYLPKLDDLENLLSERTKAIIINSPSNPLGSVFPKQLMKDIVAFSEKHDLYIISDEVYERLLFQGEHFSPAIFNTDGRVISVFSFSKTYAMNGWRVGYVVAPTLVTEIIRKLQGPLTGAACSVSQKAAEAALTGDQKCVTDMRDAFLKRRDTGIKLLKDHGLEVFSPDAGFYFFLNIQKSKLDSFAFAKKLLQETKVAVRPGGLFGERGEGYVRITFGVGEDELQEGLQRLGMYMCGFE